MDAIALIKAVKSKNSDSGSPIKEAFICQVLVEALEDGKNPSYGLVQECLQEARELEQREEEASKQESRRVSTEPNVKPSLLENSVFRILDGKVHQVRRELFEGNAEVPFPEWRDAVSWMRRLRAEGAPQRLDRKKSAKLMERVNKLAREFESLNGDQILIRRKLPILDIYVEPGSNASQLGSIRVKRWNKTLRVLLRFVDEALSETGLPRHLALLYLLTGRRRMPGISVSVPEPPTSKIAMTTIEIPRFTPSWADMRTAYNLLRSYRGNRKAPDFISREVARSIGDLGGVPEKGKMKFWKSVADDINEKENPLLDKKLTDKAVRMRFGRLPEEWKISLRA